MRLPRSPCNDPEVIRLNRCPVFLSVSDTHHPVEAFFTQPLTTGGMHFRFKVTGQSTLLLYATGQAQGYKTNPRLTSALEPKIAS